ncbi:uncharacterized protein LOC127278102 [Leptopilina boulardi]|uniref:uncharacterized protein LOC127278102 n=1 Tax=Leptopilina boulardi TaxID=63433 RepID=UPI0021F53582|nr:uncharacterized protein LOC127278102 [Leptopilina boulardi]XP_051155598.1 uncharacterized protein LOC127278102 [Leptopilina boulardi]XP_051155599.1 uncharacterized protein LOC127278102 [Leptopilina boulardi]
MKLSILIPLIIFLSPLYCTYEKAVFAIYTWKSNLETALTKETTVHQQLLLYENDFNNSNIYQLEKIISKKIPTRVADFKTIMKEDGELMELSPYLLKVTRVVIITSRIDPNNSSKVLNILDSLAEMSEQKTRPKVLIATTVEKSIKYKKFLQMCWSKQFLDVSILELKQRKDDETVLAKNSNAVDAKLNYYNPFTKRSAKMTFTNQSILFPYKLRNLNGYEIKVGMFHFPPFVNITQNSSGDVIRINGPDINLWITMSKVINFSIKKEIYNYTYWTEIYFMKDYTPRAMRKFFYNHFQAFAIQTGLTDMFGENIFERCRGTRVLRFVIVVPILPSESKSLISEWNLFEIVLVVCSILMPWLISKYLKFDERNWKLIYIVQIALGSSAPPMPEKRLERIIFNSTMLFFFLQSSTIFSTLSNFQLQKEVLNEIKTFEELYAANLTLIKYANYKTFQDNDIAYEKLFNNGIFSNMSFDDCVQLVNDYQNVSCFGREHMAYMAMQRIKNADGRMRIKIFNKVFVIPGTSLYFSEGSPFPRRCESVTADLVKSGISNKWDAEYFPKVSDEQSQVDLYKQELSVTSKILKLLIMLLIFGYPGANCRSAHGRADHVHGRPTSGSQRSGQLAN